MKKGLLLVLMIGLAGNVSAQTKVLSPTLQKSTVQKPIVEKPSLQEPASVPGAITLVYPNGGETIAQGSRQTIQWKVRGTAPAMNIELRRNGKTIQTIAKNTSATNGKLAWNVGRVQPGGGYTIRMMAVGGGLTSASKRPFSIVVPTARALSPANPAKVTPKPKASNIPETSVEKYPPVNTGTLSSAKERQSPATGLLAPEQRVTTPWFKENQRVEDASPSLVPSTGTRTFFETEDSPAQTKSPDVTSGGGQSSIYEHGTEAKLPEQPGAWYKEFVETPARQENLPMAGMETELATFPDFEVRAITFDHESRRLSIQIANCGEKDHLDAPLELRMQLDDLDPAVSRKDHITLRKGEEKPWDITLDGSWNWPIDKGRLRCDVTVDPNDTILESNEDNNRHALWLYKSSGPDVNLAADHLLVGLREKAFYSTRNLELEPEDVSEAQDQEHAFEMNVKIPLVNYGDRAASGTLFIFAPGDHSYAVVGGERVSLQKGEMRWITKRWLLGTPPPDHGIPFKMTWENDDHVLFEGNLLVTRTLFEQLGSLPELWIKGLGCFPGGKLPRVHQPLPFVITVQNRGGSTEKTFRVLVEVIGPGGNIVHRSWDTIEGLAHSYGVDDSMNHRHEFVPEESGYHHFHVKVDCNNDVPEYNEDNNENNTYGIRIYGESTDSDDRVS